MAGPPAAISGATDDSVLEMSPMSAVPVARASAMAARTAAAADAGLSGPRRCSAITSRIQPGKSSVAGSRPRIHDSSRCVCALTRPGRTATSPRSISRETGMSPAREWPNATIRPRSIRIQPSRMGGWEIGSSQSALMGHHCRLSCNHQCAPLCCLPGRLRAGYRFSSSGTLVSPSARAVARLSMRGTSRSLKIGSPSTS